MLAAVVGLAVSNAACGAANVAGSPNGVLFGRVTLCRGVPRSCRPVASTTVTVRIVHGTQIGALVAKADARSAEFSFSLPPGKYFPDAPTVHAQLEGGHCIAGEIVVGTGQKVRDDVLCFVRVSRGRPKS
jgi:hypothetical protein